MRAFVELLAVFAGIYLFDCIHWVRRETVAFRAWWRARVHAVSGEQMSGNQQHGVVVSQPLLPFGRLFLTQTFPISLTRDRACSFVLQAANPGPRPAQVGRCVRFDEAWSASTEARRVLVGGKLFVEAGSERLARRLAALLDELHELKPAARERRIESELSRMLDVGALRERLKAFDSAAKDLRTACTSELVLVFLVTPAVGLALGLPAVWIPLLGALVASQAWIALAFGRAHRALFPDERGARRTNVILMALSPPAAMRAVDVLSRDLLAEFHPLAAARALLSDAQFADCVEPVLRDALHPLPIRREGAASEVAQAAESWRARSSAAIETFALRQGVAPERWTNPPARSAADCRTWCPRCTQQFTLEEGTCARCWDLALKAFWPESAAFRGE